MRCAVQPMPNETVNTRNNDTAFGAPSAQLPADEHSWAQTPRPLFATLARNLPIAAIASARKKSVGKDLADGAVFTRGGSSRLKPRQEIAAAKLFRSALIRILSRGFLCACFF